MRTRSDSQAGSEENRLDSNGDVVEVPVEVPRDPAKYRPSQHFAQRLKQRVPVYHQGPVPAAIIENGTVTRRRWTAPDELDDPGQPVAFTGDVDGERYTVIAALRPGGYRSAETKHTVLTVYEGDPPADDGDAVAETGGDR